MKDAKFFIHKELPHISLKLTLKKPLNIVLTLKIAPTKLKLTYEKYSLTTIGPYFSHILF